MRARSVGLMVCALLGLSGLSGCGYKSLQQQDEDVRTSWSEVVSEYQRRADLASSLAGSVKASSALEGGAASERALVGVTEVSAQSSSVSAAPTVLADPAAFARYQALQDHLTQSLRHLMGLSAAYPQLQTDANFMDLRAQLAETEQRIANARNRYIEAVRTFNTAVSTFPTDLTARMFDFHPKPSMSSEMAGGNGGGPIATAAAAVATSPP
jgi:LemA protein